MAMYLRPGGHRVYASGRPASAMARVGIFVLRTRLELTKRQVDYLCKKSTRWGSRFDNLSLFCENRDMSKMHSGRPNTSLATSVEEALKTVDSYGRTHAARLMSTAGVPFSVAVRVLSEPGKRRRLNEAPTEICFPLRTE